jgi:twinkle protein
MNAHELNQRLCGNIESVLKCLFPNGKIIRGEFCVGSLAGEEGKSLKIHLGGSKKGFWCDFAGSKKGKTLLGLWAEVLNGDFAKACREAKEFLGIRDDYERHFYKPAQKLAPPPKLDKSKVAALVEDGPVLNYLCDERKLHELVVRAYRVAQTPDGAAIAFPFFQAEQTEDGIEVCDQAYMVKFLKLARENGKKEIWTTPAGVTDSLFGKKATLVDVEPGALVITEGEIDAISVAHWGYHGVSVPRGAKDATADGKSPNDAWIKADYEWLEQFERIYIWFDADEPGQAAARDVAKRIGLERSFIVSSPPGRKDANDCLVAGMTAAQCRDLFDNAKTLDPVNLQWAGEFTDAVERRLWPPGGVEPGFELPWTLPWRIRPGELTVWTGFGGHGKTVLLSQLMVHLAYCGQRVCVASMEVEPDRTLEVLWCQANGSRMPYTEAELASLGPEQAQAIGKERFRKRYQWLNERFLIFLPEDSISGTGRANWRQLMDCFLYARQRYGCEQFVVDSLMMCVGRSEDDYTEVEAFVDAMAAFAKKHQVHVHLVAHTRKREDEKSPPGKQDVAGPKETADKAHNVVVVHRNLAKAKQWRDCEHAIAKNLAAGNSQAVADAREGLAQARQLHDGEMHLLKQRNGTGENASKYLYFLQNPKQFVPGNPWSTQREDDSYPVVYLPTESEPKP